MNREGLRLTLITTASHWAANHDGATGLHIIVVIVFFVVLYPYLLVFVDGVEAESLSTGPLAPEGAVLTPVSSSSLDDSVSASS